jgi:hypothetical protein
MATPPSPPPPSPEEKVWLSALTILVITAFVLAMTQIVCSKFLQSLFFVHWMQNFGTVAKWFFTFVLIKLGVPGLIGFIAYKLLKK